MAYDEALAHRLRELLRDEQGVSEQHMFGGLAFLLNGNMCVAASSRGGLLARVDPGEADAALRAAHASPMEMRGRQVRGWIAVAPDGVATLNGLRPWVRRSVRFARSLPPKG